MYGIAGRVYFEGERKEVMRIENTGYSQRYDCIFLEIEMLQGSDITQLVGYA